MGGDDAAGACLVDELSRGRPPAKGPFSAELVAIDAGTAPESYTSIIRQRRPDLLILVDAADMGLLPGTLRTIQPDKISVLSFSTHSMPLSLFISYVEKFCGRVVLVGMQPRQTQIATRVSKEVRKSAKELAEVILEGQIAEIPLLQ
jgi:hydrogenase 3 maturation protease